MHTLVNVSKLKLICNPFINFPWIANYDQPLSFDEIKNAIDHKKLISKRLPDLKHGKTYPRHAHINRIAYFVINGVDYPIQIDVGIPSMGCYIDWIIQDGNHRFAASIYRNDETIVSSLSGSIDYMIELGLINSVNELT